MITSYWNNLNDRERLLAVIAGLLGLGYLLYLLVFSPLDKALTNRKQDLLEKKETLTWLQTIDAPSSQQSKKQQVLSNAQLLAQIGDQLAKSSFKQSSYQLQQTSAGEIQLSFEKVPFNPFLTWFWNLSADYAITIKQLSVEKTETAGIVKLLLNVEAKTK